MQGKLQPWEVYQNNKLLGIVYATTNDHAKELGCMQYNLPTTEGLSVKPRPNPIKTKGYEQ